MFLSPASLTVVRDIRRWACGSYSEASYEHKGSCCQQRQNDVEYKSHSKASGLIKSIAGNHGYRTQAARVGKMPDRQQPSKVPLSPKYFREHQRKERNNSTVA